MTRGIDWDGVGLGVETDQAIATRLGVARTTVHYQRTKRGIASAQSRSTKQRALEVIYGRPLSSVRGSALRCAEDLDRQIASRQAALDAVEAHLRELPRLPTRRPTETGHDPGARPHDGGGAGGASPSNNTPPASPGAGAPMGPTAERGDVTASTYGDEPVLLIGSAGSTPAGSIEAPTAVGRPGSPTHHVGHDPDTGCRVSTVGRGPGASPFPPDDQGRQ